MLYFLVKIIRYSMSFLNICRYYLETHSLRILRRFVKKNCEKHKMKEIIKIDFFKNHTF